VHTIVCIRLVCQYAPRKKNVFFLAGRIPRQLGNLSDVRLATQAGIGGMDPRAIRLRLMKNPLRTPGSRQDGALPHTPLPCTCLRGALRAPWQSLHPAPSWQSLDAAPAWRHVAESGLWPFVAESSRCPRWQSFHTAAGGRVLTLTLRGRVFTAAPSAAMWQSLDSDFSW